MKARLTRRAKIDSAEKNGQKQLLVIARCIFQIFALNHISYYTMKDSSHLKSCQSNCFFLLWGCRHKDWGRVIYTNSAITILRWWFICCWQYSQSPSLMKCEIVFIGIFGLVLKHVGKVERWNCDCRRWQHFPKFSVWTFPEKWVRFVVRSTALLLFFVTLTCNKFLMVKAKQALIYILFLNWKEQKIFYTLKMSSLWPLV